MQEAKFGKARLGYVAIEVPFSSRDAMVGGTLRGSGSGQSGPARGQAAAAHSRRGQTLSLHRGGFDAGVATA